MFVADANNYRLRKITQTLDVDQNNLSHAVMTIYPNPANDILNIEFLNIVSPTMILTVADATGKKLYTQQLTTSSTSINTSMYAKGVYFATIVNQNETITQKFIVE